MPYLEPRLAFLRTRIVRHQELHNTLLHLPVRAPQRIGVEKRKAPAKAPFPVHSHSPLTLPQPDARCPTPSARSSTPRTHTPAPAPHSTPPAAGKSRSPTPLTHLPVRLKSDIRVIKHLLPRGEAYNKKCTEDVQATPALHFEAKVAPRAICTKDATKVHRI